MNVSPFLLHIWRQCDARYFAHPMSCAPHICLFVPCQLWSLSNLAKLLLYIFMINYSNHHIAVCIADMPTIRCAYTPLLPPKTMHIIWFELCNVWAQPNSAYLQLCIFRRNIQILHIQVNVSRFLCRLFDAQNTPHMIPNQPVCGMSTLDPVKSSVIVVFVVNA